MPAGHDISAGPDAFFRVRALEVDAPSNSTATGVEILDAKLVGVGPGIYIAEYFIVYQCGATTTGAKFGVNHDGTVTSFTATLQLATTGTAAVSAVHDQVTTTTPTVMGSLAVRAMSTTGPNLGPWTDIDTADADMQVYIYCNIVVTAVGELELWHASETTAASTVKKGTCVRLTKAA